MDSPYLITGIVPVDRFADTIVRKNEEEIKIALTFNGSS